jgi:hypothetical protein
MIIHMTTTARPQQRYELPYRPAEQSLPVNTRHPINLVFDHFTRFAEFLANGSRTSTGRERRGNTLCRIREWDGP